MANILRSFNFLLCKLSFFLSPALFADYFFVNSEEFPNSLLLTFVTVSKSALCKTLMRFLWEVFLKMAVVAIHCSLTFDMKCSKWIYMALHERNGLEHQCTHTAPQYFCSHMGTGELNTIE